MKKITKSPSTKKIQKPKFTSKWRVESDDGRFEIDRCSDGGLVIVDRAVWNPDDKDDMQGIFTVLPEDRILFMQIIKTALATEVLEGADLYESETCPNIVVVNEPKMLKKKPRRSKK